MCTCLCLHAGRLCVCVWIGSSFSLETCTCVHSYSITEKLAYNPGVLGSKTFHVLSKMYEGSVDLLALRTSHTLTQE